MAASDYGLYTSGSVFIGHEGVARVVYQNGSHCVLPVNHEPRHRITDLYDDITDKS